MRGHVDHPLDFGGLPLEELLADDELDLGRAAPLDDLLHDAVHDVVVERLQHVQLLRLHRGEELALKRLALINDEKSEFKIVTALTRNFILCAEDLR